jgi:hypothetical protein
MNDNSMSITRNNYESFFLLYIDNELSVKEKSAVDEFVKVNPDLEEEFVMLKQTVLKADALEVDFKASLFKTEAGNQNIQQQLLLHLDNELNQEEQKAIHELIENDGVIKKEWLLLQQTKTTPDGSIVFEDKKSLYREEGKRVIMMPWLRFAAAAVITGVAIWTGVSFLAKNKQAPDAGSMVTTQSQPSSPVPAITDTVRLNTAKPGAVVEPAILAATNKVEAAKKEKLPAPPKPTQLVAKTNTMKNAQDKIPQIASNNLPIPSSENINKDNSNKTITASVTPQTPGKIIQPGKNDLSTGDIKTVEATNTFATTASYTEGEDKNDDRVFFMSEDKVKKTKLGGIFRKVKRVFERTANVKEGNNNIKIANLEFAIQ